MGEHAHFYTSSPWDYYKRLKDKKLVWGKTLALEGSQLDLESYLHHLLAV